MPPLTSNDLDYMRSAMEELLPDTCNILSATLVSDGAGGMTATWGTAYASVACRLDAIRGNEYVQGASVTPEFAYILTLPHDTTIDNEDRVEVGTHTFNVISVDLEKSWVASRRVYLERT